MCAEVTIDEESKNRLSVVLLCYNDAGTIGDCVKHAFETLDPVVDGLQVIVVEDGSKDDSRQVLQQLTAKFPRLEVVEHASNRGIGPSLGDGIHAACNRYVLCVDGDNQFDFGDAARFLELADGRYEIISGCRRPRADPWYRCVLGWIFNKIVRICFSLPVQDVDCGFKLLHRRSAEFLFPVQSTTAVWVEAMIKARNYKYRVANLKVHHRPRASGCSTVFNWSRITRLALEVIALAIGFAEREGPAHVKEVHN